MDYKLKINFQSVEMLEEKGWFDIAVNRAYYYVYQTFLLYKETKSLNKDFKRFRKQQYETFRKSNFIDLPGSHEITFFFISKWLKTLLGLDSFREFTNNFYSLKEARIQADYNLDYKYSKEKYEEIRKIFIEMVKDLKKIKMIAGQ